MPGPPSPAARDFFARFGGEEEIKALQRGAEFFRLVFVAADPSLATLGSAYLDCIALLSKN